MDYEESKPGRLTLGTLILIGVLVPILVASFLVFGLQSPLPPPGGSTTSVQAGVVVIIPAGVGGNQSLNYERPTVNVVVGINNTIRWNQEDTIPHTVTSRSVPEGANGFDSKNMEKGDSFTVTLTVPGTYDYYCIYHPGWMKGTIIVLAPKGSVSVILPNGVGSDPTLNFRPAEMVLVIGMNSTVQWVVQDPTPHTVTSISVPAGAKAFDSGIINKGDAFTVTFTVPGTYRYNCILHPGWMQGTIVVKSPS
ncbi:MAG: plastocyanin/azurin family copper-binding protein [Nitrososphaerales archaeon]|nr:plastocyanin/azurin family copper-binding protein [Nitrososphaerales archaeon]